MTLLEDIVTYLTNLGIIQGDGIDAFRDFKPEAPDNIVSLHEYKGDPASCFMAEVHRSVQVVVRNKSAVEAQTKAKQIFEALRPTSEDLRINFTPTRWGQVYLRQSPYKFSQDESDRVHYGFNVGITTTIE